MARRRVIARNVKVDYVTQEEWAEVIEGIMKEFPNEEGKKLTDEERRKLARKSVGLE